MTTMKALAFVFIAIAFLSAIPHRAQTPAPQPADAALREQGKQVFTGRCGKCHDADATKKLPDGTTLLERLAASKDPKALLATRLKSMSEQDGRGVALYMEDLLARVRTAQKTSAGER
jgi:mono/diheme cytochrome c family protein